MGRIVINVIYTYNVDDDIYFKTVEYDDHTDDLIVITKDEFDKRSYKTPQPEQPDGI